MTSGRQARIVHAFALAFTAALLGLAGHSAGSGTVPSFAPTAVIIAVSLVAAHLGRTSLGTPARMAGYLVGMQVLAHVVLWTSGSHAGTHAAHGSSLLPSGQMLAAHALATLVAIAAVTRLDDVCGQWIALWNAVLGRAPREVTCVPTSVQVRHCTAPEGHAHRGHLSAMPLRGPPRLSLVAPTG